MADYVALVQCSYMAAAYPTLNADDTCHSHRHEDRVVDLARAMAVEFQRPDPSDEQIAWFLDDADAVIDDFVPAPEAWEITDHVTMPEEPPGIVDRFRIKRRRVRPPRRRVGTRPARSVDHLPVMDRRGRPVTAADDLHFAATVVRAALTRDAD